MTELGDVALQLAERLSYPCRGYGGGHPAGHGCLECGGRGKIYPSASMLLAAAKAALAALETEANA